MGQVRKKSAWLRGLPAAEGVAGDCILAPHPEHVNARCRELHAKIRVMVVEHIVKVRSVSAIMMSWLESPSELRRLRHRVWRCLSEL